MSSVDDRVVSMKFDNTSFERNVGSSISLLDKLKASLNFSKAGDSFSEIDAAAKNVDLNSIGTAVDGIASKFTAMSVVAITALTNIVNRAVDAGINIARSFTLGPITQGFKEYETNLTSIQTILSNTMSDNTTLDDVTKALDELNEYSDKTIYNFSEMAKNIGTFTAAGVDLETSVSAIKGIANLAAISGSSSEQAATAMYQLSQAIASGTVRLQDWNSVQNAGLGGEVFQKALFETAKSLGTVANVELDTTFEEWTTANSSFRESLSEVQKEAPDAVEVLAEATADAAKSVADAEESAADAVKASSDRIVDAKKAADKAVTDGAERIAQAEKDRQESAVNSAKRISEAEENKVDTFKRADDDIQRAVENQNRTIEDSAKNVERAFDAVTDARDRLNKALQPESADNLQAATDRLTAAQLDQSESTRLIEKASDSQVEADRELTRSRKKYLELLNDPSATQDDILAASKDAERAQEKVLDLTNAVERARLKQNGIARALTKAEEELAKAKAKGTDADENVAKAQEDLEDAVTNYARVQEDAVEKEQAAADNVEKVTIAAAKRREEAIQRVTDAQNQSLEAALNAEKRVNEAVTASAEAQIRAAQNLERAEKDKAKTIERTSEAVAKAQEDAAARIAAAQETAANAPPGWLTDEVLLQTLQAFTGDLSVAQLEQLGYTAAQAQELAALGQTAQSAASDVKTITQLFGTAREAIGSGWSESFRIIIGNFEDAKGTFTDVAAGLKVFIDGFSNARNELLQGWADLGGRTVLIEGLKNAFDALLNIIRPIRDAFREIFPKKTAQDLFDLTVRFRDFTEKLKIGGETSDRIKRIFRGVFAVFEIGAAVIKGLVKGVLSLVSGLGNAAGGGVLEIFATLADGLTKLKEVLVDGGGIKTFFEDIPAAIGRFIKAISFTGIIEGFVAGVKKIWDVIAGLFGVVGSTADSAVSGSEKAFERLSSVFGGIASVIGAIVGAIKDFIGGLGKAIGDVFGSGADYSQILDGLNTGLFAGVLALIYKFINTGLKIDFSGGLFESLNQALGALTNNLQAMTNNVRADTLFKIAGALLLLTASIVILSLVDSGALTKGLAATAAGVALLVGAMAALDKIAEGPASAIKLAVLAGGLLLVAGSVAILSLSLMLLGSMDLAEIGKGLTAMAGILVLMTNSVQAFSKNSDGLIKAGIGLNIIAVGLIILAGALKIMSTIDIQDAAVGLLNIAATLQTLKVILENFPDNLISIGFGLVAIALGLAVMAGTIFLFSTLDLKTVATGLAYMSATLVAIGLSLQTFPEDSEILKIGIGLALIAGSLGILALSFYALSKLSWEELAKGLAGMAVGLTVLGIASKAIDASLGSGLALLAIASALKKLIGVVETAGKLNWATIGKGMLVLVAVLGALAIALHFITPALPALAGLGLGLLAVGAAIGIALGGIGLFLSGFADLIAALRGGSEGIKEALDLIVGLVPAFISSLVTGFAEGFLELAQVILDAAPELIPKAVEVIGQLLDAMIELAPKVGEALKTVIIEGIGVLANKEVIDKLVAAGFALLLSLLDGIGDNIAKVVASVTRIITEFLGELGKRAPDLATAGIQFLADFLIGIAQNLGAIADSVWDVIQEFALQIINYTDDIFQLGVTFLGVIIDGILDSVDIIGDGVLSFIRIVSNKMIYAMQEGGERFQDVLNAGVQFVYTVLDGILGATLIIAEKLFIFVTDLLNGLAAIIRERAPELRQAGANIAAAILSGLSFGLSDKILGLLGIDTLAATSNIAAGVSDGFKKQSGSLQQSGANAFKDVEKGFNKEGQIRSPSRVFMRIGGFIVDGLALGIDKDGNAVSSAEGMARNVTDAFNQALNKTSANVLAIEDTNPRITPVLDLSGVEREAQKLGSILTVSDLNARASFEQAASLAIQNTPQPENTVDQVDTTPKEIKFEQNVFSPTALSISELYRQTKNQIEMAKEELSLV